MALGINQPLDKQWADIFWLGCECFLDVDYDENDQTILPLLLDIIKLYSKARADQPTFAPIQSIDFDGIPVNNTSVPSPPHKILQDCQAVLPLNTPAEIHATPTPALPVVRMPKCLDDVEPCECKRKGHQFRRLGF